MSDEHHKSRLRVAGAGLAPVKAARGLAHVAAVAACLLPLAAFAQRGDAGTEGRLNQLQRTLGELSQQLEQLRRQEQQLHQQLEKMRTDYEARLERLEKTGPAKPPARPTPAPKPK